MKTQSMRLLPTLLAGGALTVLASGTSFAAPTAVPAAPTAAAPPVTAAAKTQAGVKAAPRIGMLMTDSNALPRPQGHKSGARSSSYASWLPNASEAIRRQ